MGPKPSFSLHNTISNLDLHPKLKLLLSYSLHNRRPPRGLFDSLASYYYYTTYLKPKIVRVLKDKRSYLVLFTSRSYVLYAIRLHHPLYQSNHYYYYMAGVDSDRIFINRVNGSPDICESQLIHVHDNIDICTTNDNIMHSIMGYGVDLGDKEEVTIDVTPNPITRVRVQGDLVLELMQLNENILREHIGPDRILRHMNMLMIDLINRILLEYGLSPRIMGNEILLASVAPRGNDLHYLGKLSKLLIKELKEVFGDNEVELHYVDLHGTLYEIGVKGGYNCIIRNDIVGGGYGNPYNHLRIRVECNTWWLGPGEIYNELFKEVIEALNSIPPSTYEFSIGNHYVKIANAKSLSFTYRPSKQPLTINENIINVVNPLMFIVTPNSTIELYHREHGVKSIKFRNNYIIRFDHIDTHTFYVIERNRVILRNLEL